MFSDVWSENAALFDGLMEIHSNPPILYYGFKIFMGAGRGGAVGICGPPAPPPPFHHSYTRAMHLGNMKQQVGEQELICIIIDLLNRI